MRPDRLITLPRGRSLVRKHGNHDQSSHGNWARGGKWRGTSYENGNPFYGSYVSGLQDHKKGTYYSMISDYASMRGREGIEAAEAVNELRDLMGKGADGKELTPEAEQVIEDFETAADVFMLHHDQKAAADADYQQRIETGGELDLDALAARAERTGWTLRPEMEQVFEAEHERSWEPDGKGGYNLVPDTDTFYGRYMVDNPDATYEQAFQAYLQANEETFGRIVDQSNVFIRMHEETLSSLLDRGRFMNVHQAGALNAISEHEDGGNGAERRRAYEDDVFGGSLPVYGHLYEGLDGIDPYTMHNLGDPQASLGWYGEVSVRLKRDRVVDRTTTLVGDSFANQSIATPSKMTDPKWTSVPGAIHDWSATTDGSSYWEAQIHGGVTLDDIDAVIFRHEPGPAVRYQLAIKGIPYRTVSQPNVGHDGYTSISVPSPLVKHGNHDQSSHGNWARSNPRAAASLEAWFDYGYSDIARSSDWIVDGRAESLPSSYRSTPDMKHADNLLAAIAEGKDSATAFRGILTKKPDLVERLTTVGNTVDWGISAFSLERGVAEHYATPDGTQTPILITSKITGLDVSDKGLSSEAEILTSGRFTVSSAEQVNGTWHVTLDHGGVFKPVKKHGSHDQSSHGNWARGGGSYGADRSSLSDDNDWTDEDGGAANEKLSVWQANEFGDGFNALYVVKDQNAVATADAMWENLSGDERAEIVAAIESGEKLSPKYENDELFVQAFVQTRDNAQNGFTDDPYVWAIAEAEEISDPAMEMSTEDMWNKLSPEGRAQAVFYAIADDAARAWASSASNDNLSAMIQDLANQKFPGVHRSWDSYKGNVWSNEFTPLQKTVYGTMLDAHYENTQKLLKDKLGDATHLKLYRGYTDYNPIEGTTARVRSNPLSSWSLSREIAENFSLDGDYGYVFEANVPIESIVTSAYSGLGALYEQEFVVSAPGAVKVRIH